MLCEILVRNRLRTIKCGLEILVTTQVTTVGFLYDLWRCPETVDSQHMVRGMALMKNETGT
jgi:hypothetical protein